MANQPAINQDQKQRFQRLSQIVLNQEQFLVVVNGQDYDSVAAGTALTLLLESLQKKVILYSPNSVKSKEVEALQGWDRIKTQLIENSNKLLIALDCPVDQIEKVSSQDDQGKLTLVVEFQSPDQVIDAQKIKIQAANPEFQAGFIIDASFEEGQNLVQGPLVWVSRSGTKPNWAEVSFSDQKASLSELTTTMMAHAGFQWPGSAAKNLYQGIKKTTNNFESADSIALETAAYCLKIIEKEAQGGGTMPQAVSPQAAAPAPGVPQISPEAVEQKEGVSPEGGAKTTPGWQKPPIFTGATTPKV